MLKMCRALAAVMAVVGVGALASPASADPPSFTPVSNYGGCVSAGVVDPSSSPIGPQNAQGLAESDGRGGTVLVPIGRSDGQSRFSVPGNCVH